MWVHLFILFFVLFFFFAFLQRETTFVTPVYFPRGESSFKRKTFFIEKNVILKEGAYRILSFKS